MDAEQNRSPSGRTDDAPSDAYWSAEDDGRVIAAIFSRLDRDRRLHEQKMSLGSADLRILWLFADQRPRTMREISQELHLEQSTVNRQVNVAVGEGLLERSRHEDSSAYVFMRTAKGLAAFVADVELTLGGYRSALQVMGEADAAAFMNLFGRFAAAYGQTAGPECAG